MFNISEEIKVLINTMQDDTIIATTLIQREEFQRSIAKSIKERLMTSQPFLRNVMKLNTLTINSTVLTVNLNLMKYIHFLIKYLHPSEKGFKKTSFRILKN